MSLICRVPIQHSLPRRAEDIGINGPEHARGEYYDVDDNLMRTKPRSESDINKNVDFHMPGYGSRGLTVNYRMSELKSIIKIDVDGNPRDEISYFEDMCRSLEIFDSQLRYQILTSVWPHKDIRNYYTTVEYGRRSYKSLLDNLSNRDSQLRSSSASTYV